MRHTIADLKPEASLIKDTTIQTLVLRILSEKTPAYFWECDSSSSGFYHPTVNGEPISLVDHVKSATRILYTLLSHPSIKGKFTQLEIDIMLASIILHDCAKKGVDSEGRTTQHGHPLYVSLMCPDVVSDLEKEYFTRIVENIVTHHGPYRWREGDPCVLPAIQTEQQYYVHLADWLASRKLFHVDLDNEETLEYMRRVN